MAILRPRLTPEESARWKRRLRDPLTISFTLACLLLATMVVLLTVRLYTIRREVALLAIAIETEQRERETWRGSVRDELDGLYRTVYQPVDAPENASKARQPSSVELWQKNRDAELRNRIRVLEQWRARQER